MKSARYALLAILFFCAISAGAQNYYDATVMQYNLLAYPGKDSAVRNKYFVTVMRGTLPDILVTEEMESQAGVNGFLSMVMNKDSDTYDAAPFHDGYDTDNAMFYKRKKFKCLENYPLQTALRDINRFKMVHLATSDTFYMYVAHLKASEGSDNVAKRGAEVQILRANTDAMPKGTCFMVCGDFNIYGSTETAYQELLAMDATGEGQFYDYLSMTGTFNNVKYARYHTQSPRTRAFGGGSTGGMDDRFDMILYSKAIKDGDLIGLEPGSYLAVGNDGNHYNDSINQQPNTAVSAKMADALAYASDHIPVMATFKFTEPSHHTSGIAQAPALQNSMALYPNPVQDKLHIRFELPAAGIVSWKLTDISGRELVSGTENQMHQGLNDITVETGSLSHGTYILSLTVNGSTAFGKVVK